MKFIYIITLIGTFLFAISGVLAGIKMKLDLFGLLFIGFVTSLGGGTIRDLLIGSYPIAWVADLNYVFAVLLAAIVTLLFKKYILRIRRLLMICDIIGVAIFSILGLQKCLILGTSAGAAIIFGVVSSIMGGVIRDTLCNQIPIVLRREVYASVCFLGGFVFILFSRIGVNPDICFISSVIVIIAARVLAVKYRFSLPRFHYQQYNS